MPACLLACMRTSPKKWGHRLSSVRAGQPSVHAGTVNKQHMNPVSLVGIGHLLPLERQILGGSSHLFCLASAAGCMEKQVS